MHKEKLVRMWLLLQKYQEIFFGQHNSGYGEMTVMNFGVNLITSTHVTWTVLGLSSESTWTMWGTIGHEMVSTVGYHW